MINHKNKCIYVHIPCTGGTALENLIEGSDWINVKPQQKHLTACQSKKIYKDYWDDYFKFGFVRDPLSRHASISKFEMFRGDGGSTCKVSTETISQCLNFYKKKFGSQLTGEFDYRFNESQGVPNRKEPFIKNSVYLNIYNEELDFIGKLENIQQDLFFIFDKIKMQDKRLPRFNPNSNNKYLDMYTEELKNQVEKLYKEDIIHFDY
jgi:hypothetical protein